MAPNVYVLGGGFAGLESAIQLRRAGLDVTLVSNRPYLYMFPTSIWLATGEARLDDVCLDLSSLANRHGFRFLQGPIERIDSARKRVVVGGTELAADALFIAMGGGKLQPHGVEHTHTVCAGPEDTLELRDALAALFARGHGRIAVGFGGNPKDSSAVRGGPAFELMFHIDTLLRRRRMRERFELTFFAPMASPGARMGANAATALGTLLDRRGIATRFAKKIAAFTPAGVLFEGDAELAADLVMFIPAGAGHPVVGASDLPQNDAGFVQITRGCEVVGRPDVYAIGDIAALEGPDWRAKQGHVAEVMARVAATNYAARLAGRPAHASYLEHLEISCLMDMGRGAAFVYRDHRKALFIPLPGVGHGLKKAWAAYFKLSKQNLVPRLPGM